jgi:transcriptional regulator with XRE-family HTH domain
MKRHLLPKKLTPMKKEETFNVLQGLIREAPKTDDWREQVEFRNANKDWLRKSAKIAIKVTRILREKKISQVQLAGLMAVTPQQINKILKGRENLTLETLSKLETALGVELITIIKLDEKVVKAEDWNFDVGAIFISQIKNAFNTSYASVDCGEENLQLAG